MKFPVTCRLLVLAAILVSHGVEAENPDFACAAETDGCSPAMLWAVFESAFNGNDAARGEHVPSERAASLGEAIERGNPAKVRTFIAANDLPPSTVLALQVVMGEIAPNSAAQAARALQNGPGQLALLQMLTQLDREPSLIVGLDWTLDSTETRAITLPWMLLAGSDRAVAVVLDQMRQCSELHPREECRQDLPEGQLFNLSHLQASWPHLRTSERRTLLMHMSADGLEGILRHPLLAGSEDLELLSLWSDEPPADRKVRTLLARLIMERLLDPRMSNDARLSASLHETGRSRRPIEGQFMDAELTAWFYLVKTKSAPTELWPALATSSNPWIAMLGVTALIAEDRVAEASSTLAVLSSNTGAPHPELLRLVSAFDTPAADQLFRRALAVPQQEIGAACELIRNIAPQRTRRLSTEITAWAQEVLATVPADTLPPMEDIPLKTPKENLPVPVQSLLCVVQVFTPRDRDLRPALLNLGQWLVAQPAEIYRILGATMLADIGEPGALKHLIDSLDDKGDPRREQIIEALRDTYARTSW